MKPQREDHTRYRELLSGRLDDSLTRDEARVLSLHLSRCASCRQTEREYHHQRQRLRALPAVAPPRDLWARTSTALDREVARSGPYPSVFAGRRQTLATSAVVASAAALGLSLALVVSQAVPVVIPSPGSSAAVVARSTPFTVPAQALAFLSGAEGLTIYRARVDHVCPAIAIDCMDEENAIPAVVALPRHLRPSNLSLSPDGGQLAIQGRDPAGGDVIAVLLMPADDMLPGDPDATLGFATPAASPEVGPTDPPSPEVTRAAVETTPPSGSASATSTVLIPEVTPTPKPDRTDEPSETADPLASPPVEPPMASSPLATAAAMEAVVAILDDVYSTGAPPAWSADGSMLAFSAMPADRSHGPDVYLWRAGEERARPLTTDHSSYFASWAGSRIVASRVTPPAQGEAASVQVSTVVIDPATSEERVVAGGTGLWLPTVSPLGTHVVAWHGSLGWGVNEVRPVAGALHLGGWAALDPFATDTPADSEPALEPSSPEPSAEAAASPSASPDTDEPGSSVGATDQSGTAGPTPQLTLPSGDEPPTDEPGPDASPGPDDSADPDSSARPAATDEESGVLSPAPVGEPTPAGEPMAPPLPPDFVPVEPNRDPLEQPVQDWQVRWSVDGEVLGYWIADVPGASWGRLAVVPVDPETGALDHDGALLRPSLAGRAFTLGLNRVAWVAPADDELAGELRIRTWGPDGFGDLRLRPSQLDR